MTFLWNKLLVFERRLAHLILWMGLALGVHAQERHDPKLIESQGVYYVEAYLFNEEVDSLLLTKEYFNPKGRRTQIEIFKDGVLQSDYRYQYQDDTLLFERTTFIQGQFNSKTQLYYDDKNREVKAVDFNEKNQETGTYSLTEYDDEENTKETKIYFDKKLSHHTREGFDQAGKLVDYAFNENGTWKSMISPSEGNPYCSTTEEEPVSDSSLLMEKEKLLVDKDKKIIGIGGMLSLQKGDILETERYLQISGLLAYEKQFLNGDWLFTKKYRYFKNR